MSLNFQFFVVLFFGICTNFVWSQTWGYTYPTSTPLRNPALNTTVYSACLNSTSLITKLTQKSNLTNLTSFDGWYHLDKSFKIPKYPMERFISNTDNNSYFGFGDFSYYFFSCPVQNFSCPHNATFWSVSNYPSELSLGSNNVSSLKLCVLYTFAGMSGCYQNCEIIPTAYCSQYNSFSYNLGSITWWNNLSPLDVIFCSGADTSKLEASLPKPCKIPYSSSTGYEPCEFDFNYLGLPSIEPVIDDTDPFAETDEIKYKCSVKCPNGTDCSSLSGLVYWSSPIPGWYGNLTRDLIYDKNKQELYGLIDEKDWLVYLNDEIMCEIYPSYNNNNSSFYLTSQNYYIGIKCEVTNALTYSTKNQILMTFEEGNTKALRLRCNLTIPIVCKNRKITDCDMKIWINYRNDYKNNRIVTKECIPQSNGARSCDACNKSYKKPTKTFDDSNRVQEWDLNVNMEAKNKNYNTEFYDIDIKTSNDSDTLKDFFYNLTLPFLSVVFNAKNRPLTVSGNCFNDPHCSTFDGKWFELQRPGEFLMYDNFETQSRVHLRNKLCAPEWNPIHPYCINNVYIQSMHEIIKLDLENNLFYYTNLKNKNQDVPIIFENGQALNSFQQFIVYSTGYGIQIETGYGVVIKVHGWYYWWVEKFVYSWLEINPSKGDNGKTDGLFGNYNGAYSDDFVSMRFSDEQTATENEIFESYKAGPLTGIPSFTDNEYYEYDEVEIAENHNYCDCLKNDPTISSQSECSPSLNEKTFNNKGNGRNKRSTRNTIDFERIANSESMQNVKRFGIKYFENPRRKRQAAYINLTSADCNVQSSLVDSIKLNQLCQQDYQDVPVVPWASGYDENTKSISNDILSNDINQFVTDSNGNLIPDVNLLKLTCPKNCSSHGTCNDNGECDCDQGYGLVDCSVRLADPPTIKGISLNSAVIDSSKSNPKDVILAMARYVADNPSAKIKAAIVAKKESKSLEEDVSAILGGYSLSIETTFFDIDTLTSNARSEWYLLKLSASNDGKSFSEPITLMVYPSNSYTCNTDVENFSCEKIATLTDSPSKTSSSERMKFNLFNIVLLIGLGFGKFL